MNLREAQSRVCTIRGLVEDLISEIELDDTTEDLIESLNDVATDLSFLEADDEGD